MDTEAYRYIELGYAERYPVASLRCSYQLTPKTEAKATRAQWLHEYEADHHGQLPPLTAEI